MSRAIRASSKSWSLIAALPMLLFLLACGDNGTEPATPAVVASVQVSPAQQALLVGDQHMYAARALDAQGQEIIGRAVTWSSSNAAIASVSETGTVTALAAGDIQIRATIDGKVGSGQLSISLAPVASVEVDPAQLNMVEGETRAVTFAAKDAAGRVLDGRIVAWSSTNGTVATVSTAGAITALAAGTTEIVATVEGRTGRAQLTVTPAIVSRVELSVNTLTMAEGETRTVTATARDAADRVVTGRPILWDSNDPSVVTVNGQGVLSAVQPGRALVTATIEGKYASVVVTVNRAPVASVGITPTALVLEIGESRQMTALPKDAAGNILLGRAIQWSVSDGATISPSGMVTAVRQGYVTITATSEGIAGAVAATVIQAEAFAYDLLYHRHLASGQSELFRLTIGNGSLPIRLNAGAVSRNPTSSPDGLRVAFAVSQEDLGTRQRIDDLFAVDVNGMNMKRLTSQPGHEDSPAWSPVGGRIAYHHYEIDGRSDIWIMNPDGSGQVNLTADMPATGFRSAPAWSADGTRIAFAQLDNTGTGTTASIWTMRADGTDKRQLTSTTSGFDARPTWSPDGLSIAFMRYYAGGEADITVVGTNGGAVRRIALPGLQTSPSWSPDGQLIAFVQDGASVPHIHTMRPDGSQVRLRTVDASWGGGLGPTWILKR